MTSLCGLVSAKWGPEGNETCFEKMQAEALAAGDGQPMLPLGIPCRPESQAMDIVSKKGARSFARIFHAAPSPIPTFVPSGNGQSFNYGDEWQAGGRRGMTLAAVPWSRGV